MLIDNFVKFVQKIDPVLTPKVILDIGSRDLDQSIEFNSVFQNCRIYAFEPNPLQYSICFEKTKNFSNIQVNQLACSNAEGTLDFYVTNGNVGASSLLEPLDVPFASDKTVNKIQVQTIRMFDWLRTNHIEEIDIAWVDTQGAELQVFMGMDNLIEKIKFIHCEAAEKAYYKNHSLKNELESFLNHAGFDTVFHNESYHPYNEGDIFAVNRRYYDSDIS